MPGELIDLREWRQTHGKRRPRSLSHVPLDAQPGTLWGDGLGGTWEVSPGGLLHLFEHDHPAFAPKCECGHGVGLGLAYGLDGILRCASCRSAQGASHGR